MAVHESTSTPEIILASASPRRAALLAQIGLPFRVLPSGLEEDGAAPSERMGDHERQACALARAKAEEIAAHLRRGLVIGADTIVVCQGVPYGKPRDAQEAEAILLQLAGRTHHVITAVAVVDAATGRSEGAAAVTAVHMRQIDRREAAAYVATGEPMDKAGAYGIQGRGALLVDRIEGDYSAVVGLPLPTLAALLGRFGVWVWGAAQP
jgi:nucleoside triphosphate pyrophosphatase